MDKQHTVIEISDCGLLATINLIKSNIAENADILKHIKQNEDKFLQQNEQTMDVDGSLTGGEKMKEFSQQNNDCEAQARQNLDSIQHTLQQHKRDFQAAIQRFGQITTENLGHISTLQEQIFSKLAVWKNKANQEQQREYIKFRLCCGEMEELNEKIYKQLKEIELVLQSGVMQTDNSAQLSFAQSCTAEILRLRQEHFRHFQVVKQWERNQPGITFNLHHHRISRFNSTQDSSKKIELQSIQANLIIERLGDTKMSVMQGRQILEEMQFNQDFLSSSPIRLRREDMGEPHVYILQQCLHNISQNVNHLSAIQEQVISQLTIWKYEQQQMANEHSISLDILQCWCEELAELLWEMYEQLNRLTGFQQRDGAMLDGHSANLPLFIQTHINQVHKLLQDLLNHSLIVEQQPPRVIMVRGGHRLRTPMVVVVSLLTSRILNAHANNAFPDLSACIIGEEQLNSPNVTMELEINGVEIENGNVEMHRQCDDLKRITFNSKCLSIYMSFRGPRRRDRELKRIGEMKACLLFNCNVAIGSLAFQVETVSLPVVVYSHSSQLPIANATILWDNAFGEMGRVPFEVPFAASWKEVAVKILNAKFVELTGCGLTEDSLACLARKAFRDQQPQPEMITWKKFCTDNLPGMSFTFWGWFHAALMLFKNDNSYLKNLWARGLIMGFIEKEAAEALLNCSEVGTFLLRFSESVPGAIVITTVREPAANWGYVEKERFFLRLLLCSSSSHHHRIIIEFLYSMHFSPGPGQLGCKKLRMISFFQGLERFNKLVQH